MIPIKQFFALLAARLGMFAYRLLKPGLARDFRLDLWLQPWIRRRLALDGQLPPVPDGVCRDIIFCFVDHFEPGTKNASPEQSDERFDAWMNIYPDLVRDFRDADGRHPQHCFFFPPHYYSDRYLRDLAGMDFDGLGEVELHLHHDNDTSESLRQLLEETLTTYENFGVFQVEGEQVSRSYAFIHGNWALDNSRPEYCGVTDELSILGDTGCYADFTFPSLFEAQPWMVNTLYRVPDDPGTPKSYDTGIPMAAGRRPGKGEFAIITGPLGLRPKGRFPFFSVEDADVTGEGPGTPARVHNWVREGIHVSGRPEWLFVKVHTHGAPERHRDALMGEGAAKMFATLGEHYNDGERFRLHYVNAREMYNIARAAEDGHDGDAGRYRDHEIAPYLTRSIRAGARYRAASFIPAGDRHGLPRGEFGFPDGQCRLELATGALREIRGLVEKLSITPTEDGGRLALTGPGGRVELFLQADCQVLSPTDAELQPEGDEVRNGMKLKLFRPAIDSGGDLELKIISGIKS